MTQIDPIRDGRHYDALKAQEDISFYLAQAGAAAGPVLEIGCGTGRVTIPLAAAGIEITGLDISASMLEEVRRKADRDSVRIIWVEANGSDFDLGSQFPLIIMPFNSLQFFKDSAPLKQLFDRVRRHLSREGRFVFDVFNPQVSFLAADPSARYERARYQDPHGGGEVVPGRNQGVHRRTTSGAFYTLLPRWLTTRLPYSQSGTPLLLSVRVGPNFGASRLRARGQVWGFQRFALFRSIAEADLHL